MKSADMCVFCSPTHRKPRERRMAREMGGSWRPKSFTPHRAAAIQVMGRPGHVSLWGAITTQGNEKQYLHSHAVIPAELQSQNKK